LASLFPPSTSVSLPPMFAPVICDSEHDITCPLPSKIHVNS
jgi:hypothetical protein